MVARARVAATREREALASRAAKTPVDETVAMSPDPVLRRGATRRLAAQHASLRPRAPP
jgi:hypothetical protein